MKNLSLIIIQTSFFICIGCSNDYKNGHSIETIDIESNIHNTETINLSEFTTDIKYIPLQTVENHIFTGNWHSVFLNNRIIAYNLNQCVLYSSDGRFLNSVGARGRGPGEYQFCEQADFSQDKTIIIQDFLDLLEYDSTGSYIRIYKNVFGIDFDHPEYPTIRGWKRIRDSLFFGHMPNNTGIIKYKALIINKKGQILKAFDNYEQFQRDKPVSGFIESNTDQYLFNRILHYREFMSDTLFYLNEELHLIPDYVFNLGKYKMPTSIRGGTEVVPQLWNYIAIWNVFETEDFLFLKCHFGYNFPAKRLTMYTPIPQAGPTWYNTTHMLGIYDKQSKELKFCEPSNSDNYLFTTGIYNDIDGGPRFLPDQMVNDSTMVMFIDAKKFKDHLESEDFKNSTPQNNLKKNQLEDLSKKISETDNSIMMFVTFNKNN